MGRGYVRWVLGRVGSFGPQGNRVTIPGYQYKDKYMYPPCLLALFSGKRVYPLYCTRTHEGGSAGFEPGVNRGDTLRLLRWALLNAWFGCNPHLEKGVMHGNPVRSR